MSFKEFWRRIARKKLNVFCAILFTLILLAVICAPLISPYGYDEQDYTAIKLAPSFKHLFGTDGFGRDIFTRMLYGGRISLSIGLAVSVLTTIVGGFIGCISAYFGGWVDQLIMRLFDVFSAIPALMLNLILAAALGAGPLNTILALSISGIPGKARSVRGPVLALRNMEYIEAATALDTSTLKIIVRHIVPNIMAHLIITTSLSISANIIQVSSLSFLGLGVQEPVPEWGAMLSNGRQFLRAAPWMTICPGLVMMATLFSLSILGDAVRDALDPKLKD